MTTTPGPILFLNPDVLLPRFTPEQIGGEPVYGLRNAPPQLNGSADRLNELCRAVGASLVLTRLDGLGDIRFRLAKIGLRASMPLDWFTDPLLTDRASAVAAWLAAHGNPLHMAVDRPGALPGTAIRIDVASGAEITLQPLRQPRWRFRPSSEPPTMLVYPMRQARRALIRRCLARHAPITVDTPRPRACSPGLDFSHLRQPDRGRGFRERF